MSLKVNKISNVAGTVEHDVATMGIESGSNDNGNWTKFPDGTLICTNREAKVGNPLGWNFPKAFIDIPTLSGAVEAPGDDRTINFSTPSKTAVSYYRFLNGAANSNGAMTNMIAIGRWK